MTGDAAGFALNMGVTVRGMEFAIASGILAAEAIIEAGEDCASLYEQKLKDSFVLKDLHTARKIPSFLHNDAFFSSYPASFPDLVEKIMRFGKDPKESIWKTVKGHSLFSFSTVKDFLRIRDL